MYSIYGVSYTWKHLVLMVPLFFIGLKGGSSEPIEPPLPIRLWVAIKKEANELLSYVSSTCSYPAREA